MFQIISSLFSNRSPEKNMPRVKEIRKPKLTPKRLREYYDAEEFERPATRRAISEAVDPKLG